MFIGYYQLGDILPLRVHCVDSANQDYEPDAVPSVHIYDSSGNADWSGQIPIDDRQNVTGYFRFRLNLSSAFNTGRYTILYNYIIDSTNYAKIEEFEIIAGGDNEGNGFAMHFFRQPAADFVLLQTDGGLLKKLANPTIRNER